MDFDARFEDLGLGFSDIPVGEDVVMNCLLLLGLKDTEA